ncbi:MAG: MFS transporter [Armatimonadetes bacterium]|nr:MFS transporter [Armatimonadota bacterium]
MIFARIASGLLLGGMLLIPLLAPEAHRVTALVALVGLASCAAALGSPLFNAWFANLLPSGSTAAYLATRSIVSSTVGLVAMYLVGRFLEAVPGYTGYAVLFSLGAAASAASGWALWWIPDVTRSEDEPSRMPWHGVITVPFRYPGFMWFTLFYVVWIMASYVSLPFQQVFMMKTLGIPLDRIGVITGVSTLFSLLTYKPWGKLLNRHSSRTVFVLGFYISCLIQASYLWASPHNYLVLYPSALLAGLVNAAVGLAANNLFYEVFPKSEEKVYVVGFYSAVMGVAAFIAPAAGGYLAGLLKESSFTAWGLPFDQYRLLFLLTGILRLPSILLLRYIPEEKRTSLRDLLIALSGRGRV